MQKAMNVTSKRSRITNCPAELQNLDTTKKDDAHPYPKGKVCFVFYRNST